MGDTSHQDVQPPQHPVSCRLMLRQCCKTGIALNCGARFDAEGLLTDFSLIPAGLRLPAAGDFEGEPVAAGGTCGAKAGKRLAAAHRYERSYGDLLCYKNATRSVQWPYPRAGRARPAILGRQGFGTSVSFHSMLLVGRQRCWHH